MYIICTFCSRLVLAGARGVYRLGEPFAAARSHARYCLCTYLQAPVSVFMREYSSFMNDMVSLHEYAVFTRIFKRVLCRRFIFGDCLKHLLLQAVVYCLQVLYACVVSLQECLVSVREYLISLQEYRSLAFGLCAWIFSLAARI